MLNSKKIFTMARKCQKIAANSHKRIYFSGMKEGGRADKGHCVVYTADQRRYVIPLNYLNKRLFRELLRMAEEEYGLPSHHPITLPCDAVFMDNAICLIRKDSEKIQQVILRKHCSCPCIAISAHHLRLCNKKRPTIIIQPCAFDENVTTPM